MTERFFRAFLRGDPERDAARALRNAQEFERIMGPALDRTDIIDLEDVP